MHTRVFPLYVFLFLLGFVFRMHLIKEFPQPIGFDQKQYQDYAASISEFGLYAHSFRLYGYPYFIATIQSLFGNKPVIAGLLPWQAAQILADLLVAINLVMIMRKIFHKTELSIIVFFFYLGNPFTSGYTGVMLPEILSGLLLSLSILFYLYLSRLGVLTGYFTLGLVLGFIPQVKPVYFLYSLIFFLLLIIQTARRSIFQRIGWGIVLLSIGFIIPFIYTLVGNWRWFGQLSVLDVDNLFIQNIYVSLFVKKSTFIPTSFYDYPKEIQWIYSIYSYDNDTPQKRREMQRYFLGQIYHEIRKNPRKFLQWRMEKMWYLWEKHSIFPFNNPQSKWYGKAVYSINILFLALGGVGALGLRKNKYLLILLYPVIYTTMINVFSSSEERYSLPAYPFLICFTCFGMFRVLGHLYARMSIRMRLGKRK